MCGRFSMFSHDSELVRLFDIDVMEGEHGASYNEAPSQLVRSVRMKSDGRRELDLMQWGLVPFWAKESFKPLINARAETLTEKPAFRTAAAKRRCLIPANGYYEWQVGPGGKKQPYFLSLADQDGHAASPGAEPTLAMAGIFDWPIPTDRSVNKPVSAKQTSSVEGEQQELPGWASPELSDSKDTPAHPAPTCAVVTRAASDTLGHIHQRMPLFIPKSEWELWLDPELKDLEALQRIIDDMPAAPLAPRAVGPAVGNVRNNNPDLILPMQ